MLISITRSLEWDAAHRVLRHESKCGTLHGHRYKALLTFTAPELDACGRVIDFGVVKERVGGWIDDNWDHTTICNIADVDLVEFTRTDHHTNDKRAPYIIDGEPTAENIAQELLAIAQGLLADTGVAVTCVEVFETPNCSAKAYV